jgi:hypothetical protein
MPRKQRFKPSRKPKPILQNDDAVIARQDAGATALNENAPPRDSTPARETNSLSGEGSRSA